MKESRPVSSPSSPRVHYAWIVAAVTFLVLLGGAGVRATPSVLIVPWEREFGWHAFGTRRDELLYHPDELARVQLLRKQLAALPSLEGMEVLLENIHATKSNLELVLGGLKSTR